MRATLPTPEAPALPIGFVEQAMQFMSYRGFFIDLSTTEQLAVIHATQLLAKRDGAL